MPDFSRSRITVSLAALMFSAVMFAQAPAPDAKRQGPPPGPKAGTAPKPSNSSVKPYEEVVTKEAKTQTGVFKVHRIDDTILFEIPKDLLGRDFLWMTELSATGGDGGFGNYPGAEAGTKVVRFEKHKDEIYLRLPDYNIRTKSDRGLEYGIGKSTTAPIIASLEVKAYSKNGDPVVDVTRWFNSDPQDFAVKGLVGGAGVDPSRSYIEKVTAFPTNVEADSVLTFFAGGGGARRFGGGPSAVTVTAHQSIVVLPEKPMQPRIRDSRVGYFSEYFTQYGNKGNGSKEVAYIGRYRLEKKDPTAPVSEPVTPITFYLAREVPDKWRPFLKKGIESWQPVFESAGFKNAIICKDAPSEAEDPNWSPEDARYSVVRWAPSTVFNAMGPHVSDPRSGETLSGHIIVWNDVVKLAQYWYFVQASASNPSAQHLPLSDTLTGNCLAYIIAHECGHVLGLEHNFKASAQFSIPQLRDPEFTKKWGDEASIMDYGRFNYVAQPGDGATLIPKQGPYDYFAIQYGYTPAKAADPEADLKAMEPLLMKGISDRTVRFGNSNFLDPQVQTEDLGDDPVAATTLGLKNIVRVAKYLVPATSKYGEDFSELSTVFTWLIRQRSGEIGNVLRLIGGVDVLDSHGHAPQDYTHVSKARQKQATKFVLDHAFNFEPEIFSHAIMDRIGPVGMFQTLGSSQKAILTSLFAEGRLQRLMDNEYHNGAKAYTVAELAREVQSEVWKELRTNNPDISLVRRNLQQRYLEVMQDRINGSSPSKLEFRGLAKAGLRSLRARIEEVLPHVTSPIVSAHLADCRDQIKTILEGKNVSPPVSIDLSQLFGGGLSSFCGIDDLPKSPFEGVQ